MKHVRMMGRRLRASFLDRFAGRRGGLGRRLEERKADWRGMEPMEGRLLMNGLPVISEIMAINERTLADEDGDFSDWLEIYNPSSEAVNLDGWFLTDDAADLQKWEFPNTTIEPGGFLVVFASDKNRSTAGSELHTNFRLTSAGEYLALVQEDGATVAWAYEPAYPSQFDGVSFGLPQGVQETQLVGPMAPVEVFVPTDGSLGTSWTAAGFDASSWQTGNSGIGFETEGAGPVLETYSDDFEDASIGAGWTVDNPGSAVVSEVGGVMRLDTPTGHNTFNTRGTAPMVYRDALDVDDYTVTTRVDVSNSTNTSTAGLMIYDAADGLFGLAAQWLNKTSLLIQSPEKTFVNLNLGVHNQIDLRIDRVSATSSWHVYYRFGDAGEWTLATTATDGGAGFAAIADPKPGMVTRGVTGPIRADYLNFAMTELAETETEEKYADLINLNIQDAMFDVNSSAYVRMPFQVTGDPSAYNVLTLDAQYDDGFVAYLNGTEVARRNAPVGQTWNSAATDDVDVDLGPPVTVVSNNFDSAGSAYQLIQSGTSPGASIAGGGPTGSYLHLISDGVGNQRNSVTFNHVQSQVGTSSVVTAEWDIRISGGTNPADGAFFGLISTDRYGTSGNGATATIGTVVPEEPNFPDVFAVGFDVYPATELTNDVSLHWDGVEIINTRLNQGVINLDANQFHRARLVLTPVAGGAMANLTLTPNVHGGGAPVTVYQDVFIPGYDLGAYRVEMGARTGGAFLNADFDNISVTNEPVGGNGGFETIDLSSHIGLLTEGQNVLAIHALNSAANNGDFFINAELSAKIVGQIQTDVRHYFTVPSPGSPNPTGLQGKVADPVLSVSSGAYATNQTVTVTAPADSTVYYTLDGKEPTTASATYSGPISITSTTQLKVKAFRDDYLPSNTIEGSYVRISADVETFSSNLPLVVIETFGSGITGGNQTFAFSSFIDVDPLTGRSTITDAPQWAGRSGLKERGSSSTGFPKKQYAFETWDGNNADTAVSLLGMPAESDWVLYAPYSDKTLMRNYLTYTWGNEMGQYAPRVQFVEVFLNTGGGAVSSADYVGVYVLIEKIKRDADRVDIEKLETDDVSGEDVTGGYIFKRDRLDPGDQGFGTNQYPGNPTRPFNLVEPKESEATTEQMSYLTGYLNEFEAALYGANFTDPVNGYAKYIDVDSFIDHHILTELMKNIDGYRLSTFYYKDRGGKLQIGPFWDFNLSLGNANYNGGSDPTGWYADIVGGYDYPWWDRLFQDSNFRQAYADRWAELREELFTEEKMLGDIDAVTSLLGESQQRNFTRWDILDEYVWPNPVWPPTYQENVDFMKNWLSGRLTWIDSQFVSTPQLTSSGGEVSTGFEVGIAAAEGTIYYMTDGTDPRLSGGGIAPGAIAIGDGSASVTLLPATAPVRAFVPSNDSLGTSWRSLGFDDSGWLSGSGGVAYDDAATYDPYTGLDVTAQMDGVNETIYMRRKFTVNDLGDLDTLTLNMQYDDGFVAYLNGVEIARGNAPTTLAYNSGATASHDDAAAVSFVSYDITAHLGLLQEGENVLAIHGLNYLLTSSDYLNNATITGGSSTDSMIEITENTNIFARAYNGSQWSALARGVFIVDLTPGIQISEINYNPSDPTAAEIAAGYLDNDEFEFIELKNISGQTLDLSGMSFTNGISFDFAGSAVTSLAPGEYVVVVKNMAAFTERYGTDGILIAGTFTGSLNNGGERLVLSGAVGEPLLDFEYRDNNGWPNRADGNGSTLEQTNPDGVPAGLSNRTTYMETSGNWRSSVNHNGSPGRAGGTADTMSVVINEVLAHTDVPALDSIELYNYGAAAVDISNWYLSDATGQYVKYRIPAGTILPAGGYMVFDESHFNPTPLNPGPNDFGLSGSHGDDVWLLSGDGTKPVLFVDHVEFGGSFNGVSFGRVRNGSGDLFPTQSVTLGGANSSPIHSDVVISEIMYNDATNDTGLEFVELYNGGASSVSLANWRLDGAVAYTFGAGVSIAPGGTLVVLPFDPNSATELAAFEAVYGSLTGLNVVGGYSGNLDNGGERLRLERPDAPPIDEPNFTPYVVVDDVRYDDTAPWPVSADGGGSSLNRVRADFYGNVAANWQAGAPTPGSVDVITTGDTNGDATINAADIDRLYQNVGLGGENPLYDLNDDGRVTQADVAMLVEGILGTFFGDADLNGAVSIGDLTVLAENFGGTGTWAMGDFTGEGNISIGDLTVLAENFGRTAGGLSGGGGAVASAPQSSGASADVSLVAIEGGGSSDSGVGDSASWSHIDDVLADSKKKDKKGGAADVVDVLGEVAA